MTPLDYILLALLALSFFGGLQQGLLRSVMSLLGWCVGFIFAIHHYTQAMPFFNMLSHDIMLQKILAFMSILIGIVFIAKLFAMTLKRGITMIKLSWLDNLAGGVFSVIKSLIIFSILLNSLTPWFATNSIWQHSKIIQTLEPFAKKLPSLAKIAYDNELSQI